MAYMRDASGKRLDSLVVASEFGVHRPSPGKLAWTNLTAITPTPVPRSIGTDGWVYAALSGGSNRMTRSGDGFATAETTFRFSDAPLSDARAVQYVTRTPEGYVAILCDAAGTTASIYFSTQWNVAASWTKVLDLGMVANISISRWVPRTGGQGTVQLVGEYGNADTRSLYLTEDGGQTWRVIRTHTRQAGGAGVNNHFHGACYDPATGRIWSSAGDEANNWFGYTDDEGATWVPVPANGVGPESGGTPFNHPTVVTPTSKRIITTPDGAVGNTGIWEVDKVTGENAVSHEVARTQPFRQWSRAPWAQSGDELYLLFPPDTTLGDTARIFVTATGDGGDSWHIVHEEAVDQANDQYFVGIVGPDSAGRIYLAKSNAGVVSLRSAPKLTWHRTATGAALADLPERLSEKVLKSALVAPMRGLRIAEMVAAEPISNAAALATISEVTNFAASGSTGSTYGNPIHYPYNQAGKWRFLGFVPVQATPGGTPIAYYHNAILGTAPASTGELPAGRVEFMHNGSSVEIILGAAYDGQYRIMADGQWVMAAASTRMTSDGSRHIVKCDFGSRAIRRVTVEIERLRFGGINTGGIDNIWPASPPPTKALLLGDSYLYGQGAQRFGSGMASTLAAAVGWRDVYNCGLRGSGYLNGASYSLPFGARIAPALAAIGTPDAVVMLGSVNDSLANNAAWTATAVGAAAAAVYAQLATACPSAPVFVSGYQFLKGPGSVTQETLDKHAAIKAAALAAPNVVWIDNASADDPWVTGVGNAGTRTFADAVLNSTTTITSATAAFTANDVGSVISGTGIPANTRIASVTNATAAVMAASATASATGVSVTITNTKGLGTADIIISADGVHPTQEGHDIYGQRLGHAIRNWYLSQLRGLG